eukprot:Selendium_serpulae@DN8651_c0_g1_i1.p1
MRLKQLSNESQLIEFDENGKKSGLRYERLSSTECWQSWRCRSGTQRLSDPNSDAANISPDHVLLKPNEQRELSEAAQLKRKTVRTRPPNRSLAHQLFFRGWPKKCFTKNLSLLHADLMPYGVTPFL